MTIKNTFVKVIIFCSLFRKSNQICYHSCFYIQWWFWAAIVIPVFAILFVAVLIYQKKCGKDRRRVGITNHNRKQVIVWSTNATFPINTAQPPEYQSSASHGVYPMDAGYPPPHYPIPPQGNALNGVEHPFGTGYGFTPQATVPYPKQFEMTKREKGMYTASKLLECPD